MIDADNHTGGKYAQINVVNFTNQPNKQDHTRHRADDVEQVKVAMAEIKYSPNFSVQKRNEKRLSKG